jgi:hypothetical protein
LIIYPDQGEMMGAPDFSEVCNTFPEITILSKYHKSAHLKIRLE